MASVIITSTLLGIAAIIIRKIFGKRTGIKPFIAMWTIVFLKFAVPIELPSHLSVMNLFAGSNSSAKNIVEVLPEKDVFTNENTQNTPAEITTAPTSEQNVNYKNQAVSVPTQEQDKIPANLQNNTETADIANSIYFSVTALLLFCIMFAIIICTVRFHHLPKLENVLCESIAKASGIKRRISIRSGDIDTPAVFGVILPVIILPETIDKSDEKLLRHIMLHETCHIKHFDPLWNILTLIICAANWYNPVVWICRYMYLADAEKLCDMSVLDIIGNENRREYAKSLLDCASSKNHPVMLVSGFGENGLKSRIKNIMGRKKVRIIAVIAVFCAIIVSAVIFGTSKNISVGTIDGDSKISDENDLYYFSQTIEDDDGKAGNLIVRVYKRSVYYVDISFESEKYTLNSLKSTTSMSRVTNYRIFTNNSDKGEYIPANEPQGYFDETKYELPLDVNDPDYSIDANFNGSDGNANVTITLEYKLKKGIFSAGSHSFTCSFDPLESSDNTSFSSEFALMDNTAGFTSKYNEETDEFELRSDNTDIMFTISDRYDGFYALKNVNGTELKQHFGMNISPVDGTPDVSDIFLCDIDSDGVDDIAVVTYYRDSMITLINGTDLSEIAIDEEAVDALLDIKIKQLSDIEFDVSCAGTEHVFTLEAPVRQRLSLDDDGDPQCVRNISYNVENGRICADYYLYLNNDDIPLYCYLTSVNVEFEYPGGMLVPTSADMDTGNNIYYIKDEPAAKATEVYWKYEIDGYNIPYGAELVYADGKYYIRSVNTQTGIYYGACELPIEKLPDDIDECFRFTLLDKKDPGLIIFAQPTERSAFGDNMYDAIFFDLDLTGKPHKSDIIDTYGEILESIRISENLSSEWEYLSDSYESDSGRVNTRLEQKGNDIYVIDKAYVGGNYRAIEGIDIKLAIRESDTAQTVYYSADGEVTKTLSVVSGRLFDISGIFNDISGSLTLCEYLGNDFDASGSAYTVTEINAGGEKYVFTIYDSGVLKFEYNDLTEFYKLDDAKKFRNDTLGVTLNYMDYIAQSFIYQLNERERSTGELAAMVDENCEFGSPSDWNIFKGLTVITDAKYVKIAEDKTSCTYKISFNVNSFSPEPFKNGDNVYEIIISQNEKGETKITSFNEI